MASLKKMLILGEKYGSKSRKGRRIWFHFWSLEQKSIEVERCFEMANS